ncbi:hypothetical protein [Terrihabitans rhizophilus]|jgi:hypothetical protein|uniref:Uncharacterized protein n=1 Tax=Terrihabitans rhizophilus TaxID=3092662 RepID=A0ABU4RM44_9HYPH|nr:hypothetical protein [Terrihabitans sp. PJ23]MDX6805894.1 hypothetical protein [Terrihabitans sp. PJ23]
METRTAYIRTLGQAWVVQRPSEKPQLFATRDAAVRALLMWANSAHPAPTVIQVQIAAKDGAPTRVAFEAVPGALVFSGSPAEIERTS